MEGKIVYKEKYVQQILDNRYNTKWSKYGVKEAEYEEKEMDHFDVYRCTVYILYIWCIGKQGWEGGGG